MHKAVILLALVVATAACASAEDKDIALDKQRCAAYGLRPDQVPMCVMQRDMQREKLSQQRLLTGE